MMSADLARLALAALEQATRALDDRVAQDLPADAPPEFHAADNNRHPVPVIRNEEANVL
jgi:hypothetical protein